MPLSKCSPSGWHFERHSPKYYLQIRFLILYKLYNVLLPNYNQLNEWPLQFLRTGDYARSYGFLDGRTTAGNWWYGTNSLITYGCGLRSWTSTVYAQRGDVRGVGYALRCVAAKANQLANFPLNFLRTGDYVYSAGSLYNRATDGYWWSATRSSATNANTLSTYTTRVIPLSNYDRGNGFALRCVTTSNGITSST